MTTSSPKDETRLRDVLRPVADGVLDPPGTAPAVEDPRARRDRLARPRDLTAPVNQAVVLVLSHLDLDENPAGERFPFAQADYGEELKGPVIKRWKPLFENARPPVDEQLLSALLKELAGVLGPSRQAVEAKARARGVAIPLLLEARKIRPPHARRMVAAAMFGAGDAADAGNLFEKEFEKEALHLLEEQGDR